MKISCLVQNVSLWRRTYGTIRLSCCAAGNKRPRRASPLPISYFMGNCIQLSCFVIRMAAKSPFCLNSILLHNCIGLRLNPVMLKPKDHHCPLGYNLSGLIQGIGSYLRTIKGCQARYFKDRQL